MKSEGFEFFIRGDQVVVGHDSEYADVSNPRGELIGECHYIVAQDQKGYRLAHLARAFTRNGNMLNEMSVDRLQVLVDHLNAFHPTLNANWWVPITPEYGSEAYQREGTEYEMLQLEMASES